MSTVYQRLPQEKLLSKHRRECRMSAHLRCEVLNTKERAMKYTAELFGTFVLIFAGLGAAVLSGSQIGIVGIAFAFGLALMAMAYAVGPVSGCHINPAVSLAMVINKRMSVSEMLGYWVAQIIGGTIGAAVVLFIAMQARGGYNAAVAGFAANGYGAHSPG